MPVIRKEQLREDLKKRDIANVYLLCGEETFLRDLAARTIANFAFSDGDLRDFNETEFSLNQADGVRAALSAAEQLPMMSVRRLIKITDVRISAGGRLDTIKDEHEKMLADFLENPPQQTIVVFIADELNGTRKLSKLLKEKCVTVEFDRLDNADVMKWAKEKIAEAGSEIDAEALRHLAGLVNADLRRLLNEITKLSTAALPEKRINIEMINDSIANTRETGQWDFVNQLNAGRKAEALAALKKMLDDGAEPLMILGQIAASFRRITLDGRSDPVKMARKMRKLAETDLAMKTSVGASGPFGLRMHIEKLACELMII